MPTPRPRFSGDREPLRQRRARAALPWCALAVSCAYLLLDAPMTALLGGVWGVLVALLLVSTPLAAVWWVAEHGTLGWRVWRAGLLVGGVVVALYAAVFIGTLR